MAGPLQGVTVVEMAGIGPAPFAAMMLVDMGARVIRVDRIPSPWKSALQDVMRNDSVVDRGRESIAVDLKNDLAIRVVLEIVAKADILIEGFRPGVMERLGLGPEVCLARNPGLIYGRMTGWGQTGPLSRAAGHDLNYIALSGALHAIGPKSIPPVPPLNLVGDYGGGGMLMALGVVAALYEARGSGLGQVVDAAMSDGAATLMAAQYGLRNKNLWRDERESNFLDGSAPFYATYECADGKCIAIACIEPQFYQEMLARCGIDDPVMNDQWDRARWAEQKTCLSAWFRRETRDAWSALLEGTDVCFAPVLTMAEAPDHPHNRARQTFSTSQGTTQPAPAPRFGRTASELPAVAPPIGKDTGRVLTEFGYSPSDVADLKASGAIHAWPH